MVMKMMIMKKRVMMTVIRIMLWHKGKVKK